MTKFLTAVALLSAISCFGQDMGISFNSRDVVRMDLWIFGLSSETSVDESNTTHLNEELRVAIDKINL